MRLRSESSMTEALAVYVHVPFCPSKCGYCDFNSYAMSDEIVGRTVSATIEEIRRSPHRGRRAKTIFFGGGTPTYLESGDLLALLDAVVECHPPLGNCEISSEANPGTVDSSKFVAMKQAGFNRISIGAQSFADGDLIRLGRVHRAGEIERSVAAAREAGFENLNIDLMFALPAQTRAGWLSNLERAISLGTEHLSLYCLTIEHNTKFYKLFLKGLLDLPDDGAQAEMYEMAVGAVERAGFRQYEISNFARPGFECRHNLAYWRGEEYAGYGPGAVEQVGGIRWTHIKHPVRYCEAVERGEELACERETLGATEKRMEKIMLGLRLNEGLRLGDIEVDEAGLRAMIGTGWVERDDGVVRLTKEGRRFCNRVVLALV